MASRFPPRARRDWPCASSLVLALGLGLLAVDSSLRAQGPVLNEIMGSNGTTLFDEDGDTPDWIEIYNPGATAVDLAGYGLTDGEELGRWTFPSIQLGPRGHLLVFASGKDRGDAAPHWETLIDRGDTWRYLVPTSEPSAAWRSPGFNDGSWSSGATGIGYGDGDDATEVPAGTISVYARRTFQIADPTAISHIFLDIDYDDGFVAYLNGVEVARENIGNPERPPRYNDVSITFTEPRLTSGLPLSHHDLGSSRGLLRAGENVLAIQVHNTGSGSSDLTLLPFLTLGMAAPPAGARGAAEILRASLPALHANFRIDSEGETIRLSSPSGALLDTLFTGSLPADVSIGRFPDGAANIAFHVEATPGRSNASPGFTGISSEPTFSHEGGFHAGPITLSLSTADAGGTVYFTLDGTEPSANSTRFTSAIRLSTTTVVRARVLEDDAIPGRSVTRTYFIGETSTLPTVSISTAPANFFDNETGIYVLGDTHEADFPYFGANIWEDWERPVHLELYEPDGTLGFALGAGAKIFGGWSRAHPQHSLSFFARSQYGANEIRYRLFPKKKIRRFESFVLRNSGNDWQSTHFRDAMATSLLEDLNVDRQAYRPAQMFINGEYWGIMNLREKVNEHFLASNHAEVDKSAIDLLERNSVVIHGDSEHYDTLVALVGSSNLADPAVYAQVKAMVDVENFIDYQAAQIYFDNTDWPGNNIKFWRPRVEGGRWRWILFDTDFGFGIWNANNFVNNTLAFALEPNGPGWPNPPWSTLLLRRLVTSPEFVEDFVNRFATHLDTIFVASKIVARINELAAVLEPEMPRQRARFGSNVSAWRTNVQNMRNFATRRRSYVRSHLTSRFGLGAGANLSLESVPRDGGSIAVQGREIPSLPWTGEYFQGLPIRLEAVPRPGFRFVGWEGVTPVESPRASVTLAAGGLTVRARFEIDCESLGGLVIHEISYNASPDGAPSPTSPGDWIELHNRSGRAIDLGGWRIEDESKTGGFTIPASTRVAAGGYLVLCEDLARFAARHPSVSSAIGDLGFALDGGSETIRVLDSSGMLVDLVTYEDEAPWPAGTDGVDATLALMNSALDNSYPGHWAASVSGGTPGAANLDVFREIEVSCAPDHIAFRRGDCNGDAAVDISDAVCALLWLFQGGADPGCLAALNVDGSADVNITDPIYLLAHLFGGGPDPVAPYPSCGPGDAASDETLGCETPPAGCE